MPVSIWPDLPAPAGGRGPALCPGPVTAAAAGKVIAAFSRPGDLVVAIDGDRLDPASPAPGTASPPGGTRVHSDLLVFTKPGGSRP